VSEHATEEHVDDVSVVLVPIGGCNRLFKLANVSLGCDWTIIGGRLLLGLPWEDERRFGDASESVPPTSEQAFWQLGHRPSASGPCNQSAKCSVQKTFPQHKVLQGTTAFSKQIPQSRSAAYLFNLLGFLGTGDRRAAGMWVTRLEFGMKWKVLGVSAPRSR